MLGVPDTGSCVSIRIKIGHPARRHEVIHAGSTAASEPAEYNAVTANKLQNFRSEAQCMLKVLNVH